MLSHVVEADGPLSQLSLLMPVLDVSKAAPWKTHLMRGNSAGGLSALQGPLVRKAWTLLSALSSPQGTREAGGQQKSGGHAHE